jgi:ribonucleoside-diphosphate reductase beta chain
MYSVFNRSNNNALEEPMFLGNSVNVSRFDKQRYPFFEKLTEKQISFFWRPEEIDLAKDKIDFAQLTPHEQHIFISNLKYQTLLDSVQGRSPNVVLLPLTSLPELETWIETWAFYETIHSRSYTHILRNIFTEPSEVLDDIMVNKNILKRARKKQKRKQRYKLRKTRKSKALSQVKAI